MLFSPSHQIREHKYDPKKQALGRILCCFEKTISSVLYCIALYLSVSLLQMAMILMSYYSWWYHIFSSAGCGASICRPASVKIQGWLRFDKEALLYPVPCFHSFVPLLYGFLSAYQIQRDRQFSLFYRRWGDRGLKNQAHTISAPATGCFRQARARCRLTLIPVR